MLGDLRDIAVSATSDLGKDLDGKICGKSDALEELSKTRLRLLGVRPKQIASHLLGTATCNGDPASSREQIGQVPDRSSEVSAAAIEACVKPVLALGIQGRGNPIPTDGGRIELRALVDLGIRMVETGPDVKWMAGGRVDARKPCPSPRMAG